MGFKARIILHLGGIVISIALIMGLALHTRFYITLFVLALLLILQTIILLRYISTTNQQLTRFLLAVHHADFSQSFRGHLPDRGFQELGAAFDAVLDRFRRERTEKEELAAHLQIFIQQVPVPILCLDGEGAITISNNALRRLIGATGPVTHLQQVQVFSTQLASVLQSISPDTDLTVRLQDSPGGHHLKINCSVLRTRHKQQKLLSIQDIRRDLDAGEVQAWQNLIRVMTHEIMNSIAPIVSLADTSGTTVDDARRCLPEEMLEARASLDDASAGIAVIRNRSEGLLRFVQSYRALARLPRPELGAVRVSSLFESIEKLMAPMASKGQVATRYSCTPPTLRVVADSALLEQALINILTNAFDAVRSCSEASIEIDATSSQNGEISINVKDNGEGIKADNLENVFVPFFTTKRHGSGIGMSLVRQIAVQHGGRVTLESTVGQGTTVTLSLPAG